LEPHSSSPKSTHQLCGGSPAQISARSCVRYIGKPHLRLDSRASNLLSNTCLLLQCNAIYKLSIIAWTTVRQKLVAHRQSVMTYFAVSKRKLSVDLTLLPTHFHRMPITNHLPKSYITLAFSPWCLFSTVHTGPLYFLYHDVGMEQSDAITREKCIHKLSDSVPHDPRVFRTSPSTTPTLRQFLFPFLCTAG